MEGRKERARFPGELRKKGGKGKVENSLTWKRLNCRKEEIWKEIHRQKRGKRQVEKVYDNSISLALGII